MNAITFEKIDNQPSTESGSYTSLDSNLPVGNAYYPPKMIDLDDTYSFSKIIVIENTAEKAIVGNFYPNSRTGKVSIAFGASRRILREKSGFVLTDLWLMENRIYSTKSPPRQAEPGI